jgi:uncharacterized membrane protein
LSLLPIITDWVGKDPDHALPAAFYGAIALGAGLAYSILVRAIIRANGKDSRVARAVGSDLKGNLSVVLYAAGTGLAFVTSVASYVLYAGVGLMWFVPDRRFVNSEGGSEASVAPSDS